ncbi:hypothetical protein [Pseudoxanthomonas indica]|uniref:TonB protein C-terminal n=1 Tax=Pseudoxanthomonas indica TaxID=428993 RepID=A0A1T5LQY0_9GAMM|nr:hypothetical protein [Pseudoxanthomonas indica]GGD38512.1 hypothetical protein GCM10007235_08310 [Pseudoxanthomonas indica]SKC78437.1 hypothetical protein SAMN06296058_2952 [Pseudoxanthomonas indica]
MKRISLFCLLWAGATAHAAEPAPAQRPPTVLNLPLDVGVDAQGKVTDVVPDATVPEPLKPGLVRRASEWQFAPPMWQGQPAALRGRVLVRVQFAATTDGKTVAQIVDAKGSEPIKAFLGTEVPQFPQSAAKRGVGGTFVHTMRQGADGSLSDMQLLWSGGEGSKKKWATQFDGSLREVYAKARRQPVIINGQPMACHGQLTFHFSAIGPQEPPEPASEREAREAAIAAWRAATPDECPMLTLTTDVSGQLL